MNVADRKLFGLGIGLCLGVIVLDQVTKAIVEKVMESHPFGIPVLPFFSLVAAWNKGVSFSQLGFLAPWMLAGGAILVSLILIGWLTRIDNRLQAIGVGLIAGGALGNVIDRLRAGAVFDFLDVYVKAGGREWHWPAFNVADSAITVGVVLLLFHGLFQSADRAKTEHS
ncbi:MAG TPA: signal peptidase II [Dongiaceae bacterium]|jgi:signal peptidase II|nr:signal peptidase II [Dongiaceae bacterium]